MIGVSAGDRFKALLSSAPPFALGVGEGEGLSYSAPELFGPPREDPGARGVSELGLFI